MTTDLAGIDIESVPEIRIRYGTSSHYAAMELSQCGDVDTKLANVRFDTMPGAANPDQFVLVLGEGLAVLPLNLSGQELRITLGAQEIGDLHERVMRATGRGGVSSESRYGWLDPNCKESVIGYKVLGRTTKNARSTKQTIVPSAPGAPGTQAFDGGPFDGNFAPSFLDADGETLVAAPIPRPGGTQRDIGPQPGDWIDYLHGPLTFTCCLGHDARETWREITTTAPEKPGGGGIPIPTPGRARTPRMATDFWKPDRAYKRGDVVFMTDPGTGKTRIYGAVCDIPANQMSPVDAVAAQTGPTVPDGQVPEHGQQTPAQAAQAVPGAQVPAGP